MNENRCEDNLSDKARLRALRETGLMDAPAEAVFDVFTRLASRLLNVPVALVSLVDGHRQFFKSMIGLPEPWATRRETPLSYSFCQHVVKSGKMLRIEDAREDVLVRDNLAVKDLGVVAYLGIPLKTADGYPLGSFCAVDAKVRKWTAEEIGSLRDLATALMGEIEWRRHAYAARRDVAIRDKFIAVLSHELRTPLTPVLLTAAAMAADVRLSAEVREDAALIQRNIEIETRLIDDLLDVARISSGKFRMNAGEVEIHSVLKVAISVCAGDAEAKGISIEQDLRAKETWVTGDAGRLQQVFWNLLKNGIKFSASGQSVQVTTFNEEGRVVVRVVDQGMGLRGNQLSSVFEAFEQGDADTTKKFGGLGLGLSICKGVVDLHGGRIEAESLGVGKGAAFTVSLPTITTKHAAEKPDSGNKAGARPGRILLVDDHVDTLRSMRRLLERNGHQVVTAETMAKAEEAANAGGVDLLISDIGLPDGSGFELMERLRGRCRVGGIAVTGYGMESDVEQALAAGFSRHLTKPVNFVELERAIGELLGG